MKHSFILYSSFFLLCLTMSTSHAMPQVLQRKGCEELVRKEYSMTPDGTLTIENVHGSINITTEAHKNTITLSATKKASSAQKLAALRITDDRPAANRLNIRTAHDEDEVPGTVDYVLSIPSDITLKVVNHEGAISVSDVFGTVFAKTVQGDITLNNIHNDAKACTKKSGSIVLNNIDGAVGTYANKGNITIIEPRKTVEARITTKGNIDVQCTKPLHNAQVCLKTGSGNISLALPSNTHADFQAKAEKGKVVCEHDLKIKPFTTKLNDKAWAQFKKEVHAFLGSETALDNQVKLYAKNGSISVLESNPKSGDGATRKSV